MYESINNTMYNTGEDGSCTCKTDPWHVVMCCLVFKIFSVRTNGKFFFTNGNDMWYYSFTENEGQI